MVVLGSMSLGGDIVPVENLAGCLQVAFDAGAKRLLLPMASVKDIPTIPGELFAKFQTGFYADATDAVFKALGGGMTKVLVPVRFKVTTFTPDKFIPLHLFGGEAFHMRPCHFETLGVPFAVATTADDV